MKKKIILYFVLLIGCITFLVNISCSPGSTGDTAPAQASRKLQGTATGVVAQEVVPVPGAIKEAAEKFILDIVSDGTGKIEEHQGVTTIDAFRANLDGTPPGEIVLYLQFHIGEGGRAYYLLVYRENDSAPAQRVAWVRTHDEYMDMGYCEIVDMDKDGRHEILIVGDTDCTAAAELQLYTLEHDTLRNLIPVDFEGAIAYFPCDVDGDGKDEILALDIDQEKNSRSIIINVLAPDNQGFYRIQEKSQETGKLLDLAFETAVQKDAFHRPHIDLNLLLEGLRENKRIPRNIEKLQPQLEKLYYKYRSNHWGHTEIVRAMGWKDHRAALPFLEKLITSADREDARAEAAAAIVVINGKASLELLFSTVQQQLEREGDWKNFDYGFAYRLVERMLFLGDRRGLEIAIRQAKNRDLVTAFRRNIVYWVLGQLCHDSETVSVLRGLAASDPDAEIRRLASIRLE